LPKWEVPTGDGLKQLGIVSAPQEMQLDSVCSEPPARYLDRIEQRSPERL
jgi:hypothetical protein